MTSVVILISGRGSNMRSIVDAGLPADIRAVISNRPDAAGLAYARDRGIATEVVDHTAYADRAAFDAALAACIDRHAPALVVLAGFMRILTPGFVEHYRGRMINIHPSLLPAFTGLHTHRRAIEAGCRVAGVTVHFVTGELDGGPIIAQAAVPVLAGDTETTLAARVLVQEHLLYPQVVRWFVDGRLALRDGRAVLRGDAAPDSAALCVPSADV
ncbi:phosphoribosylglycinamide formyltransferase [Methyloversatilis sp. XJ19-13]|uniref:phosphoribosylglycinamide formyltransferase n=1 Tax=Methyloversatilis sp. XJ19-13 TaxID=2963430 RepID=UPI00211BC38A|nr:phosphoribosylglycinamide formyltransferase [Methyloversatilis sp. XJ19-13]MCQ9374227.1 phosphoribosylglycinamide formyltransferase [Methyloversatilis sp. XJ19-13]